MSIGKVFVNGIYVNLKRLIFGSDCVTDLQLRQDALNGNIQPSPKVAQLECIGCGGCANVCPTRAITMKPIAAMSIPYAILRGAEGSLPLEAKYENTAILTGVSATT